MRRLACQADVLMILHHWLEAGQIPKPSWLVLVFSMN